MVDVPSVPRFVEAATWSPDVAMLQNGWRPTGGPVNPEADQGLLNWPLKSLVDRTAYLKAGLDALNLRAGSVVTVGPGGTYATINEALNALSDRRPAYVSGGIVTEIRLQAGFVMAEQVHVAGVNLGWIRITAVDPVTTINRAALTVEVLERFPAFAATDGGVLPTIAALFEMNTSGTAALRDGVMTRGASAKIETGCGVRRAGGSGLFIRSASTVTALGSDFSEAGEHGANVITSSVLNAGLIDLSDAGQNGVHASQGASVNVESATIAGCGSNGIMCLAGARVAAGTANARRGASDATSDFVVLGGGIIQATGGTGGTSIAANTVTASGIIFK